MTNTDITRKVKEALPQSLLEMYEFRGDLTLLVRVEDLERVARFVKDDPDLSFDLIIDAAGVDMYRPEGRFEVVYNIYSLKNKRYLRLKVRVEEEHAVVPTLTGVWPGANWHERETFDMFGIKFDGHPDLRRFYMPEEFEYYPLRKDFPLMGIPDSLPLPRR
jgi:NADH-quinone oxidoreductase subunit C